MRRVGPQPRAAHWWWAAEGGRGCGCERPPTRSFIIRRHPKTARTAVGADEPEDAGVEKEVGAVGGDEQNRLGWSLARLRRPRRQRAGRRGRPLRLRAGRRGRPRRLRARRRRRRGRRRGPGGRGHGRRRRSRGRRQRRWRRRLRAPALRRRRHRRRERGAPRRRRRRRGRRGHRRGSAEQGEQEARAGGHPGGEPARPDPLRRVRPSPARSTHALAGGARDEVGGSRVDEDACRRF